MTIYVFTLLAVLFVLFSWVVFRVISIAKHAHKPIFDVNPALSGIICLVLAATAAYELYHVFHAINQGNIRVVVGGRWSGTHGFTIYRAQNPGGFWEAICFYGYGVLIFIWLPLAEITLALRRKRHPNTHKRHEF